MMKKRIVEIAVKVVVAALTAFLTAITTTSCLGHGRSYSISRAKGIIAKTSGKQLSEVFFVSIYLYEIQSGMR